MSCDLIWFREAAGRLPRSTVGFAQVSDEVEYGSGLEQLPACGCCFDAIIVLFHEHAEVSLMQPRQ